MGLMLKTKKDDKKKPAVKIYSEQYYYARKLYFMAKPITNNEICHAYTSNEIAKMVSAEFNIRLPASSIRRWSITPDKDFEGRTWKQEWDKRIAIGIKNGANRLAFSEHPPKSTQSIDNKVETPMKAISEVSKKIFINNIKITLDIGRLAILLIEEIKKEYEKTGRINTKKFKFLQPFYISAKEFLNNDIAEAIEKLKALETKDPEILFGKHVALKDPMARERVRNALKTFMEIAYKNPEKSTTNNNGVSEVGLADKS